MSATDVDEGDNARISYDLEVTSYEEDIEYFRWDDKTGDVWLQREFSGDKPVGTVFLLQV